MWVLSLLPTLSPLAPHPQSRLSPSSLCQPLSLPSRAPLQSPAATAAPSGLILCKADTPRPPPHWKDQLLGEEEVWAVSIYKTLCPGAWPLQSSFGGHSRCKGRNPGFSPCPSLPLQTPPYHWHQPRTQLLQFPPTAHY